MKNYIDQFDDDTEIYIFGSAIPNINANPYVVYPINNGFMVDRVPILKKGTLKDEYGDVYEIIYHENEVCERELIDRKIPYVKTSMRDFKESFTALTRAKEFFK